MEYNLPERVNVFADRFLTKFYSRPTKQKFIHDPIWGTIPIEDYELAILDTPLLQRLRQIHQTGFVYQTFPSARHTRFEHTIGVMHIAGRIAEALRPRFDSVVNSETRIRVRLAALFHDVGHAAFSHTSEDVYKSCPDLSSLLRKGGTFEGKGAGEVLSYLIATSPAFASFYKLLQSDFSILKNIEIGHFAPLILGRAADATKQFEADIISGPFDADKLDYFPRDGRAAGISLPLDVDRLLLCLELVETPKHDGKTYALVVNRGGFNPIQQLLFARATLSATVYHHQKVRACDCMVKGMYEYFKDNRLPFKKNRCFPGVDLSSAADFLHVTDADFFSEAYSHEEDSYPHSLIHSLFYRRLLRRVLTISKHTIADSDEDLVKAGYDAFFNLRENPVGVRELAHRIHDMAGIAAPKYEVWVDIPHRPALAKAGDAFINLSPRGKEPKLERLREIIPVKTWVDTYDQYYAQSYIFGPADNDSRKRIAAAAVKILKEDFKLTLKPNAFPSEVGDA